MWSTRAAAPRRPSQTAQPPAGPEVPPSPTGAISRFSHTWWPTCLCRTEQASINSLRQIEERTYYLPRVILY
eukprot:2314575-Heterocapsa_arctica.AAC.1